MALIEDLENLEMTRLGNDRNKDDKMAEVAIATAQAMGSSGSGSQRGGSGGSSEQYYQLDKKMERVINSVDNIHNSVSCFFNLTEFGNYLFLNFYADVRTPCNRMFCIIIEIFCYVIFSQAVFEFSPIGQFS